jgi:hypothetical protein
LGESDKNLAKTGDRSTVGRDLGVGQVLAEALFDLPRGVLGSGGRDIRFHLQLVVTRACVHPDHRELAAEDLDEFGIFPNLLAVSSLGGLEFEVQLFVRLESCGPAALQHGRSRFVGIGGRGSANDLNGRAGHRAEKGG